MTFGNVKSIIEKNLLESYNNEKEFKKTLKEFKHNVLNNKSMSKAYALYDQLSIPQGLSEQEAKDFLDEGISLLMKILPLVKLPKTLSEHTDNKYFDLDVLTSTTKLDLHERINARKNIIKILTSKKENIKESINLPIKSMVSIANQTLRGYIENLDENSKKEFFKIISEDTKKLQDKFETLREATINKLNNMLENETETEIRTKLTETIDKLKIEKFDQISYLRLKTLEESI
jgi:hypothetical protein